MGEYSKKAIKGKELDIIFFEEVIRIYKKDSISGQFANEQLVRISKRLKSMLVAEVGKLGVVSINYDAKWRKSNV